MVTIIGYTKRQNAEGKEFFTLNLMGGIELIKSSKTGSFYATAFKSSITSTFNEDVCKSLIGLALFKRLNVSLMSMQFPARER